MKDKKYLHPEDALEEKVSPSNERAKVAKRQLMHDLRNRITSLFLGCTLIAGCQSAKVLEVQSYKGSKSSNDDLHVIYVNSNRVQQKCLFFDAEAENKWRHQYYMYVLNEKDEAIEIMQSTNQDKETCNSQKKEIDRILGSDRFVRICVRGELKKSPMTSEFLTFDTICNSKKCYGDNSAWVDTCPGFTKH